jgi:hypothetical protein
MFKQADCFVASLLAMTVAYCSFGLIAQTTLTLS